MTSVKYQIKNAESFPINALGGTTAVHAVGNPSLRCPHCLKQGIFFAVTQHDIVITSQHKVSDGKFVNKGFATTLRICPNEECRGPVFCIFENQKLAHSYPAETIDFDASEIPANLATTLEEAIKCYSSKCFRASALMVRRLLEEICEARNAKGKDLKEKIRALKSSVVLPDELLEAADHLRLLGNDAAHIESKTYDDIGTEEIAIAIQLAKEILKGVYQYGGLLRQLKSLQKAS
jgi:hypothetical protein